ncbi:precorrin-2 C(20)-methyltransferase [Chloroflexota bacterium]
MGNKAGKQGVGPGDPELLTVRATRILSRVPVIFAPQKDGESKSYARRIIADMINESEQRVIEMVFPMTKDTGRLTDYWDKAAETIWQYLSNGKDCAFITEGDPFFYGTFIHVFEILQKNHPEVRIEVIPGISSINAATARALFPLATGSERVAILPATYEDKAIRKTLNDFDTVIFLKINTVFDKILNILEELNLVEKCVFVSRCTTKDEEIIKDISKLKGQKLDYLSLLIVRR